MQNSELMDDTNCVITQCQISLRDYVKNDSSDSYKYEAWEYDRIMQQKQIGFDTIKLESIKDDDNDDECNNIKVVMLTSEHEDQSLSIENCSEWQKIQWENDILSDSCNFKSEIEYCLPQLSYIISQNYLSIEDDDIDFPIKFPKIFRRTIFDYYPISVQENPYFFQMDRRFFPILPQENDSISKSLQNSNGFVSIVNGEIKNQTNLNMEWDNSISAETGRLFIYETSEQHSPFRMQSLLTSLIVAYSNDPQNANSSLGVSKHVKRKSPFFGALSDVSHQLALENRFFRVPVYLHSTKPTDFLLIFTGNRWKIRRFDGILLGGKQMPLMKIHNPKSDYFRKLMMRVVVQLFIDMESVPVDILAAVLSSVDFLNIEAELHKFATLTNDKKFWKLKQTEPLSQSIIKKGFYGNVEIEDYMIWSSILSYLTSYDYIQPDKRQKKTEKKKVHKNSSSPWSISKSYLNGIHKGFWKLGNFEDPTGKNQMDSFLFVRTLVPKRIILKTDLRKLTVYETHRLLKKFQFSSEALKNTKKKRWNLVNHLSTLAATDMGGNLDMEKYARDTKTNRRLLRKKYVQQCQEIFELNRKILSNSKEADSENESNDDILKAQTKEITIEDFRKYLQETSNNSKNEVLPMICNPENAKKLTENPLKYFVIYRKKEGVVKKEIYPVSEYVLNYLKHAKSGRFTKKLYGLGDLAKREKQQLRDKLRRQERYKKRRIEMNLPIEIDSQDTTDKICSSCGRKGHIRTNQECPNFDKPLELNKQESNNTGKSTSKTKLLKQESLVSNDQIESPYQEISQKKTGNLIKRSWKQFSDKNASLNIKQEESFILSDQMGISDHEMNLMKVYPSTKRSSKLSIEKTPVKRLKLESSDVNDQSSSLCKRSNIQKTTPLKRSMKQLKEKYSTLERHKQNSIHPMKKEKETKNSKSNEENEDFIIEIPRKYLTTKKRKPRQKKPLIEKLSICPAIVAPYENEPIIFQKDDTINSTTKTPETSSDNEFKIYLDPEQVKRILGQNESIANQNPTVSDEYEITIPEKYLKQESESMNIHNHESEHNSNNEVESEEDEEFTIYFELKEKPEDQD